MLQRLTTHSREPKERGRAYYFKEFENTRPSLYNGTPNSGIAKRWIREIKKKMRTLNILKYFRYRLATYKINGEANYWWKFMSKGRDINEIT